MRIAVYLSALVLGCGGSGEVDEVDGDDASPELVADAFELVREPISAPDITRRGYAQLVDMARESDRVAVLVRLGNPQYRQRQTLFLSDDGGVSFDPVTLPEAATDKFSGVVLQGDRTVLLQLADQIVVHPLGADGQLASPVVLGPLPVARDGDRLTSAAVLGGDLQLRSFDLVSATVSETVVDLPDGTCEWGFQLHEGSWRRFCYTLDERCVDRVSGTPPTFARTCVPRGDWPVPQRTRQLQVTTNSGTWMLFYDAGHTFAWPADPSPGEAPLDLGPGAPDGLFVGGNLHPSASDLLRLEVPFGASGSPRLVHLERDGLDDDVSFPESPCVDACQANLAALAPGANDGSWLAVWMLHDETDERLVVGTVTPGAPSSISEGGEPIRRWPREGVFAESALELTCARAVACYPHVSMSDCVAAWMAVGHADADAEPSFERFIATADCAGFRDTSPGLFEPSEAYPGCTSMCLGDVAVDCYEGSSFVAIDCRVEGTPCKTDAGGATCGDADPSLCGRCDGDRRVLCDGTGHVRVNDCAASGLACVTSTDFLEPICSPGRSAVRRVWTCDGTLATFATNDGWIFQREDCDRVDLPCHGGVCGLTESDARTCDPDVQGSACDGHRATYCARGELRHIDCPALGYTTCAWAEPLDRPGLAWCTNETPTR